MHPGQVAAVSSEGQRLIGIWQDMNTRKVVAIWHHEGSEYKVPPVNSNYHRDLIERPLRQSPKPLNIVQVSDGCQHVVTSICHPPVLAVAFWHQNLVDAITADALFCSLPMQPEGPSWEVDGHHVKWQQWDLRVGFNYREGLVLHQVGYAFCPSEQAAEICRTICYEIMGFLPQRAFHQPPRMPQV